MVEQISVYIDEAGDPGARDGLKYLPGRHEWLCISAFAVRTKRDPDLVEWVRELREAANSKQAEALHYARITRERREAVCSMLATKKARVFCVASHKSNLREYLNPRLGAFTGGGKLYNWCVRILFERLTLWIQRWYEEKGIPAAPLRVTFANRGGHDYEHMFAYFDLLRSQHAHGTKKLSSAGLEPPFLDREDWVVEPAEKIAGLQLADVIASAVYQGVNAASPQFDLAPALALQPIFGTDRSGIANSGLTALPFQSQAPIPEESRPLFEAFGYASEGLAGPGLR